MAIVLFYGQNVNKWFYKKPIPINEVNVINLILPSNSKKFKYEFEFAKYLRGTKYLSSFIEQVKSKNQ